MFRVIRSDRLEIEIWQIFYVYNEKHYLIAKLLLHFRKLWSLNLIACQNFDRKLGSSSFCTCAVKNIDSTCNLVYCKYLPIDNIRFHIIENRGH